MRSSSMSRVNTRPGELAIASSSSNSTNVVLTSCPRTLTARLAGSMRSSPVSTAGSSARSVGPAQLGAAQRGLDAAAELAHGERLGDVVVGAELEPEHLVDLLRLGGEHDDRHRRARAQPAADLEPVEHRQHHVEHDQVEGLLGEAVQRLAAVVGADHLVAVLAQGIGEQRLNRAARRLRAGCDGSALASDPRNSLETRGGSAREGYAAQPCSTCASTARRSCRRCSPFSSRPSRSRAASRRSSAARSPPTRSTAAARSPSSAASARRFRTADPAAATTAAWLPSRRPAARGRRVRRLHAPLRRPDGRRRALADHRGRACGRASIRDASWSSPTATRSRRGARAQLSGTAALLELARVFRAGRSLRRTLVLVSTSGGTAGLAGAREFAKHPGWPRRRRARARRHGRGEDAPAARRTVLERAGDRASAARRDGSPGAAHRGRPALRAVTGSPSAHRAAGLPADALRAGRARTTAARPPCCSRPPASAARAARSTCRASACSPSGARRCAR